MDTVLLAVKQTAEVIQEAEGGVRYLTSADFGGGGGGDATLAEQQTQTALLEDIKTNTAGGNSVVSSEHGLHLTFNNIANCPVSPATNVAGWNTHYSTNVVQSATVTGNTVVLVCNGKFSIGDSYHPTGLINIKDHDGYIVSIGNSCFNGGLTGNNILSCETGYNCFQGMTANSFTYLGTHVKDGCFYNSDTAKLNFPNATHIASLFYRGNSTVEEVCFPSVETVAEHFMKECINLWSISLPKARNLGTSALDNGGVHQQLIWNLYLPEVVDVGGYFCRACLGNGFEMHIEKMAHAGVGSFTNQTGLLGTVFTNKAFANNPIFQAFVAANTITVVIVDLDRVEKTFTNPTLTSSSTAGSWVAMDGYDTVELVLTMGTLANPPVVALEVSYDGTNAVRCGTVVGEQNLAKTISDFKANAKYMRYYVVTGGSSIGAGTSIKLFATKS